jgi:hypothetical protein
MNILKRRELPKSVERQMPQSWASKQVQKAYIAEPMQADEIPDDMPTVEDWFRIRIWTDEIEGRSLTL